MSRSVELIVSGYVRLNDSNALENLPAHEAMVAGASWRTRTGFSKVEPTSLYASIAASTCRVAPSDSVSLSGLAGSRGPRKRRRRLIFASRRSMQSKS